MKRIWMVVSCCAFIAACGGNSENAEYESYYDRDASAEAPVYSDSANEAEISASTRQSEVDTNLNNIGIDRTATGTGDAPATGAATTAPAATATTTSAGTSTTGNTGAARTTGTSSSTAAAAQQSYEKGKNLIATSDCLACHQVDQKLVGPGYVEVAQKYEFNDKNVDYLANKIIEGGAGAWGQIPMSPHPDLSRENAREMARYILSLNK